MSNTDDSPLDLTGLDFGPAWAKDEKPIRDYSKEVGPRKGGRGDNRRGGGGGGPRREGGGRNNDRRDNNSNKQDRRNNDRRGNDRRQPNRRDSDRRGGNGRREFRERQPEVAAPEGFTGTVMPVEEGLDNLSREIQAGGRTYSVFDLARVVMGARERFNVTFEAPKGTKMFRCKSDGSVWLTKEEAVQQFWRADLLSELYEEVETTVEAPKGNFTSISKCGLSGKLLGPPNYHSFPTTVAALHAERFAHMSLEDYKRKIRTESGEEVVNAWMESMTKQVHFRPLTSAEITANRLSRKAAEEALKAAESKDKSEESPKADAETEATPTAEAEPASEEVVVATEEASPAPEETPAAEATETPEQTAEVSTENASTEETAPENAEASEQEAPEAEAEAPKEEKTPLITERRELERHFVEHHFKHLFTEVDRAWVPGNVPGKLLSPSLLTLLKETVAEERRYPSKLTPILCRQLSGRHLAVFKWKKKLKAGPARPHAVPEAIDLAERPQQLLAWVIKNSSKKLEELWKDILPEDADETIKRNYYHDLHWLLNQGYVLLMADSSLHLAKNPTPPAPPQKKKESATTESKQAEKPAEPEAQKSPVAEAPTEEAPKAEKTEAATAEAPSTDNGSEQSGPDAATETQA